MPNPIGGGATGPGPSSSGHYDLLQAGRGAASLWVVLFHSVNIYPRSALPVALARFQAISGWGWLGVHVFFAISGWCIAERVSKGRSKGESGWHFAVERALRIFPTYWAALFGAIALRIAAVPFNTAHLSESVPAGWPGWIGCIFLVSPYIDRPLYLLVSWSLVYELGFYLCASIALVAARRRIAGSNALFGIGCLLCLPAWVYHGTPAPWRILDLWPDFFAGVAAWWATRKGAKTSGYLALALMLAATIAWPAYGGIGRLTAVGSAWVMALAWGWDGRIMRTPLMRPLIWVGGISYSLYLAHVPLISPVENLLGRWIPSASNWFIIVWAFAIALALVGGWCLNLFVEMPVERWRKRAI
jgi:peptidoglycan/LPS O-acetylase OafA/YrhL